MTQPPQNAFSPIPGPEVIREFNDRGTLWLFEDPVYLRDLLRLVVPDLAARLDVAAAERVNRSFVPPDLQKQESDLIFRMPLRGAYEGEREIWIYVLLEHQSRPDPHMAFRLLEYMVELWAIQRRRWEDGNVPEARRRFSPILPLVFYTGEKNWSEPRRLVRLMDTVPDVERFVPAWETLFLNLQAVTPETLERMATAVGWALRVLQAERAPFAELERVVREALAGLEGLEDEQRGQWLRAVWYLVLVTFHRREAAEYHILGAEIRQQAAASHFRMTAEVTHMGESMAQLVERRGREVGRREGEVAQLRRSIEAALVKRLQRQPGEFTAVLERATVAQLETWFDRALTATTLEEVGIPTTGEG